MVRYRLNVRGHFIPVGDMGSECSEWEEYQKGNDYIFTCKTNPDIQRVYGADEVVTFH